ncbi:MAG: S4 domain-containing protein YaaA [Bacillaceae bacterium]|nr:S4 domain-containing protein YaaA [Bacillaceae bacterium]
MESKVVITSEYITLGQMLKETGVIDTGGMAKWFLSEHEIHVNGELENRRGKKLYNGDIVEIISIGSYKVVSDVE